MYAVNGILNYALNAANYSYSLVVESSRSITEYAPEAIQFASEGDIGGFARRSLNLITSFDAPVYGVIALAVFYRLGISIKKTFKVGIYPVSSFLLKHALSYGIAKPEIAIELSILKHRPDSLKIALEACPPSILEDELSKYFEMACNIGSREVINILLEKGVSLETAYLKVDADGGNVLHVACIAISVTNEDEDVRTVPIVYKGITIAYKDVRINAVDRKKSQTKVFHYLLSLPDVKEKINDKDDKGKTPIHYLTYNLSELGELMIQNGADLTIQADMGATVLDLACARNAPEDILYLVRKGLHFNLDKKLPFVFSYPRRYREECALFKIMTDQTILKLIDERALDLFYMDPGTKNSLFHLAIIHSRLDLLENLLQRLKLKRNVTPRWIMERELGIRRTLPGFSFLPSVRNAEGKTFLQVAIEIAKGFEPASIEQGKVIRAIKSLLEDGIYTDFEVSYEVFEVIPGLFELFPDSR